MLSSATAAAAPPPPEVSCAPDSLFELLAAFPVPQLLTTSTPLPCVPAAASASASDDAIADAVASASHALLASSGYTALRALSPAAADGLSPLARRVHERLSLLESELRGGLSAKPAPPLPERWARRDDARMALRPRPPAPSPLPPQSIAAGGAAPSPPRRPRRAAPVPSPSPAASASAGAAALIASDRRDAASLRELCALLPGAAQPFRGVARERLTAFLSALTEPPAAGAAVGDAAMAGAAACCACVAHASFDPAALADDTAAHLVALLAAVARRAARRVKDGAGGRAEFECLRALLGGLAALVCETRLDVCGASELLRLEEIGLDCLVRVPAGARDAAAAAECAAFVSGAAARLYRCVWARLDAQRGAASARLLARCAPLGDALLQRHDALSGAMPLTVALLAAAQAAPPVPPVRGARGRADAEAHAAQCKQWAARVVAQFAHTDFAERRERDAAALTVLQLCEDLARLLGQPEWPAADPLLRALLAHLAQERTQQLFVDAILRVALAVSAAPLASPVKPLPPIDVGLVQQWRRLSGADGAARVIIKKEEKDGADEEDTKPRPSRGAEAVGADAEEEVGEEEWCRAVVYFALTRRASDTSDRATAALWRDARNAHVLFWASAPHPMNSLRRDAAVDALTCGPAVSLSLSLSATDALPWADVCACAWRLCAAGPDAVVGAAGALRLVAPLLRVLRGPAAESARVHAAAHVARLAAHVAPLLPHVWPVAQRCVRDESARVREASVGLLAALADAEAALAGRCAALLLPLLRDRSHAVAARAIAALDALLAGRRLDAVPQVVAAALSQLVALLADADSRHSDAVARLFTRRWTSAGPREETPAPDAIAPTAALTAVAAESPAQRAARELSGLAAAAAPYPHEAARDAPLLLLLRAMAGAADHQQQQHQQQKQQQQKQKLLQPQLCAAMAAAAKALWAEQRRLAPSADAVAALAAIAALAATRADWVEPLLSALTQALSLPSCDGASAAAAAAAQEFHGAALLHVCRTLREVLLSPRAPAVALDDAARALTQVLARYVGPHQQRVLVAACGALSATITSGADQDTGRANPRYLSTCYALMNTYYVRTRAITPTLQRDSRAVAYVLRFLFLLSEFLRQYGGWREPYRELAEADTLGGNVPNQLARGEGICANVYAAVEDVVAACPPDARARTDVIALRVLASLCMLQPAVFLRRSEPHLRRALDPAGGDAALQAQGLALVRDFLVDEDARVDRAAARNARVPVAGLSDDTETGSTNSKCKDNGKCMNGNGNGSAGRRRLVALASGAAAAAAVAEQNSGMTAWAMQRFHSDIAQLCGSGALAVRSAALDVFRLCAEGGLLPPARYAAAVIALAADPQSSAVRGAAAAVIAMHCERDEDVVAASAVTGVTRAYDTRVACGVDAVRSAIVAADDSCDRYEEGKEEEEEKDEEEGKGASLECVHGALFVLLRKKHRDALVSALLRFFCHDTKAAQWLREHSTHTGAGDLFTDAPCPFSFLAHIALVVAAFPYASEADVLHAADGCRAAMDFAAQNCCDFVAAHRQRVAAHSGSNSNSRRSRGGGVGGRGTDHTDCEALAVEVWRSFGVLCAARLRVFFRRAYSVHSGRPKADGRAKGAQRRARWDARGGPGRRAAVVALQRELSALVGEMAPLWAPGGPRDDAALEKVHDAIAAVLEAEERDALEAAKRPRPRARQPAGRKARRRVEAEPDSSSTSSSEESEGSESCSSDTDESLSEEEST